MEEFQKNGKREAENMFIRLIQENKLPYWAQIAIINEVKQLREKLKKEKTEWKKCLKNK